MCPIDCQCRMKLFIPRCSCIVIYWRPRIRYIYMIEKKKETRLFPLSVKQTTSIGNKGLRFKGIKLHLKYLDFWWIWHMCVRACVCVYRHQKYLFLDILGCNYSLLLINNLQFCNLYIRETLSYHNDERKAHKKDTYEILRTYWCTCN